MYSAITLYCITITLHYYLKKQTNMVKKCHMLRDLRIWIKLYQSEFLICYLTEQIIKEEMYIYKVSLNIFDININPPINTFEQKEEKNNQYIY